MSDRPMNRKPATTWMACFVQMAITAITLLVIFRPWLKDWTVPLNYQGDTIFQLVLIKSIAQNGWTWFLPELSAPMSGFHAIAFPQNISFSWAVMKVISVFTSEPGLILNFFWFISIALTSISCHVALRTLNIPTGITLLLSTLYSVLPYAFMRNTTHISLTYIFVPIVAAYAIKIISDHPQEYFATSKSIDFSQPLLWLSCAAIGLDYIYTAYFACCFLLLAGILGSCANKNFQPIKTSITPLLLIAGFALLNLAPTIWSWYHDGLPPNMGYKSYADVETYGLKIRHLLSSPALMELNPRLSHLQYPLENENRSAMLGIFGGIGFIAAVLYGLLAHRQQQKYLWGAGVLTITGTLLGTIGGFGAVLSLLIGPDIRAYNRVSPFIAFFSFFILSHLLVCATRNIKNHLERYKIRSIASASVAYLGLIILFILALTDQSYTARPLLNRYASDYSQTLEERLFIKAIESHHPELTHFYQLPETPFPVDGGMNKMGPYDHGRPFVWSQHLRWSWPNFSMQGQTWLEKLSRPNSPEFLKDLVYSGFDAIWLDRNGYEQDSVQSLEKNLQSQLGQATLTSKSGRYAVYSLVKLIKKSEASNSKQEGRIEREKFLNDPVSVNYAKGFYPLEHVGQDLIPLRWAMNQAELVFYNFSDTRKNIQFRALLSYNTGGQLSILSNGESKKVILQNGKMDFALPITLSPNSKVVVKLKYEGPAIYAPNDPRILFLSFQNPTIFVEQ
jgi:hypothetical protein